VAEAVEIKTVGEAAVSAEIQAAALDLRLFGEAAEVLLIQVGEIPAAAVAIGAVSAAAVILAAAEAAVIGRKIRQKYVICITTIR
jgi:tetrahydromethanopterin S-methyltransferase subunit E